MVGDSYDSSNTGGTGNLNFSGAIYVFTGSGANWTEQAFLKASNAGRSDGLGSSVAISGDTVVAGARFGNSNAGAAYVFNRNNNVWAEQSILTASNAGIGDGFGTRVAINGGTVVIGSPDHAHLGATDSGVAYVFIRTDDSSWIERSLLSASNFESSDGFGSSVAIHDNTLVVGATGEDSKGTGSPGDNSVTAAGAAYIWGAPID